MRREQKPRPRRYPISGIDSQSCVVCGDSERRCVTSWRGVDGLASVLASGIRYVTVFSMYAIFQHFSRRSEDGENEFGNACSYPPRYSPLLGFVDALGMYRALVYAGLENLSSMLKHWRSVRKWGR